MSGAQLVVIVGPIASGKSTVAAALGRRLRRAGRSVAVVDLDDVVELVGGFADLAPQLWQRAQLVNGALVGAWLGHGVDVIAHGPFFTRDEDDALLCAVPDGIDPQRLHLRTTYDVALERVAGDPGRTLSRNPALLRRTYDRFEELLSAMPPARWSFDTTTASVREVVDRVATALLRSER